MMVSKVSENTNLMKMFSIILTFFNTYQYYSHHCRNQDSNSSLMRSAARGTELSNSQPNIHPVCVVCVRVCVVCTAVHVFDISHSWCCLYPVSFISKKTQPLMQYAICYLCFQTWILKYFLPPVLEYMPDREDVAPSELKNPGILDMKQVGFHRMVVPVMRGEQLMLCIFHLWTHNKAVHSHQIVTSASLLVGGIAKLIWQNHWALMLFSLPNFI